MSDRPTSRSAGSDYADAVRDVLEHAAESAATGSRAPPRRPALTHPAVVAVSALGLAAVVAWNVSQWRTTPEPLTPAQAEASLNVAVLAARQAVEQYREEHGSLPPSLQELGFSPGVRLEITADGYRIVGEDGGHSAHLDAAASPQAILDAVADAQR